MAQTHHLSQAAYDRLQAEHHDLTTRGRVEIARKIEAARELGDLSENGDYHAAKEEQGKMEGRIRQIAAMLENAEIVAGDENGDSVSHGSVVAIRYEGDDDVERYLIGSIEERHDDLDVISPSSPLGKALLGAGPGDDVSFIAPTGAQLKVTVVTVEQ
jgi:transcription elongation factor GreA